ncbi:MAG: ArsR/SmtB family transcription factor [Actinomycetota bacterium]
MRYGRHVPRRRRASTSDNRACAARPGIARSGRRRPPRRTFGDPARWRIFCALAQGPRSVSAICEELDTYQSQVSGHLAVLRRVGLVEASRTGYFNIYRVDGRALDLLSERLRELSRRSR